MELTKNKSSYGQLCYQIERNIVKRPTLTGKQTERNTRKNLSKNYHLIMSIFSLFNFVSSIKFFGLNQMVSMRDLFFLFIFDFSCLKGNIKSPR